MESACKVIIYQHQLIIENLTWNQIEQAIHELDGKTKTLVTLGAGDDCYMSIGGGESGKYLVKPYLK